MTEVWLNGAFMALSEASVSISDRGLLLGDGAFETMRVSDGALRRWPRHQARLAAGLEFLGLSAPIPDAPAICAALSTRLSLPNAVARLTITRGGKTDAVGGGLIAPDGAVPQILITLTPNAAPNAPLTVAVLSAPRRAGLPAEAFKLSGYGGMIQARQVAQALGAERALVTAVPDHALACADSANLFWIEGSQVFTPALSTGALPGTARAALIEAMRAEGLKVEEGHFGQEALQRAEAAFTTNAVEGVRAMSRVVIEDGEAVQLDADHSLLMRLAKLEAAAP